MKTKILLILLLSLIFNQTGFACCWSYPIGKLYVTDENNKHINVKVWIYTNTKDSALMKKSKPSSYVTDTNVYRFWNYYYRGDHSAREKFLRIQADGYADVVIKNIVFDEESLKIPIIVIKMYAKKYIKSGDKITLLDQYYCNKSLLVKDSTEINMKDYVESVQKSASAMAGSTATIMAVESYPNPVTDYLILKINAPVTKPYSLSLVDMQGKLISQSALTLQETKYDLQWITQGNYILMVYDPKGQPVFSKKFVKS